LIERQNSCYCFTKKKRGESGKMLKAKGSKPINEKGIDETKLKPPSSLHQSE